jgi:hypothetical protein
LSRISRHQLWLARVNACRGGRFARHDWDRRRCALGLALSQILIHVINPQSFNWTMTTRVPWELLLAVAAALVATSAARCACGPQSRFG